MQGSVIVMTRCNARSWDRYPARARNGWIIFYTHDVAEQPSEWGCTPAQLEAVVGYAAQRLPVLPVRDVAVRVVGRPASRAAA